MKNKLYVHIAGINPAVEAESWAFLMQRIQFFTDFPCFALLLNGATDKCGKPLVELPNGCVVSLVFLAVWVEKP
jgi:hypothetical protein